MMNRISTLIRLFLRNNPRFPNSKVTDYIEAIKIVKNRCPELQITGVWPIVEPLDKNRKWKDRLRVSGQSTRLIDGYIQELFNTGIVRVVDHYNGDIANDVTFNRFMQRISIEHPMIVNFCKVEKNDGGYLVSLLVERGKLYGGMNKVNLVKLK